MLLSMSHNLFLIIVDSSSNIVNLYTYLYVQ